MGRDGGIGRRGGSRRAGDAGEINGKGDESLSVV